MEFINSASEIVKCATNIKFFDHISSDDVEQTINICTELTKSYDESHDVCHHVKVFKNSIDIVNQLTDLSDEKRIIILVTYASLLHDTIDNKYPDKIDQKEQKLVEFLRKKCPESKSDVLWIINNMSYSKEVKYGYPQHEDPIVILARDIVSDADKIEAIGEIGIVRCRQYNIAAFNAEGSELERLVIEHCVDKLLKLMPKFIRTGPAVMTSLTSLGRFGLTATAVAVTAGPGKILAEPRHQYILDYVEQHKID